MIKLPDFIIVPYQLLEDKKITLVDERLYGIIYWFTKLKNESCTASNKTLAELVKSTTGTIQNSLTKLEELGYIQRIFKDTKKKTRKEIIALVVFSKVSPTSDTSQKVSPSNDTVSPTDDTRYHPQVNRIRIYNKNSKEYTETSSVEVSNIIKSFEIINPASKKFYGNITQRKACEALIKEYGFDRVKIVVEKTLPKTNTLAFFPSVNTPLQLQEKWSALSSAILKHKNKSDVEKNKQGICL